MALIKNATFWFNLIEIHATRATPLGRNVSKATQIKLPGQGTPAVRAERLQRGGGWLNKYCQNTCQMAKQRAGQAGANKPVGYTASQRLRLCIARKALSGRAYWHCTKWSNSSTAGGVTESGRALEAVCKSIWFDLNLKASVRRRVSLSASRTTPTPSTISLHSTPRGDDLARDFHVKVTCRRRVPLT